MNKRLRIQKLGIRAISFLLLCFLSLFILIFSEHLLLRYAQANSSTPRSVCPTNLETLTTFLLRDLPSYANRITQRARRRGTVDVYGYFIVAGRAEFAPLTLGPGEYQPAIPKEQDNIQQFFFTTLQRRYTTTKAIELQDYHWLFLTKTERGWQLVMMFSATGFYPGGKPPTAPRDSSNGVIAQAIEIWLRDCRAGVIRF